MTADNVRCLKVCWTGQLVSWRLARKAKRQKWNMLDQLLKTIIRVQRAALASSQWPVGLSVVSGLSGFFA